MAISLYQKSKMCSIKFFLIVFVFLGLTSCNQTKVLDVEPRTQTESSHINAATLEKITSIKEGTKIILIRHAEKQKDRSNPELSQEGISRANNLAKLFTNIPLDAIYSTDYNRTRNTVQKIAAAKEMSLSIYETNDYPNFSKQVLSAHENKVILIVGHSNTTPELIKTILNSDNTEYIGHEDYDNFYFINSNGLGDGKLSKYKY